MRQRSNSTPESNSAANQTSNVDRYYWKELWDYVFIDGIGGKKIPVPIVKIGKDTFIRLENGELFNAEYAKRITKGGKPLQVQPISERNIDGIVFSLNKKVGPLRLDIDHLTGLTLDSGGKEGDLSKIASRSMMA